MRGLRDKVAIVAGAAPGNIGGATALRLAQEGMKVTAADFNEAAARAVVDQIKSAGGHAVARAFDITKEASYEQLIDFTVKEFGGLDGLFNVAADLSVNNIGRDTDVTSVPLDVWQHTIDVTLTGYMYGVRHALPLLIKRGGGVIVNTTSSEVWMGEDVRVAYQTAKSGLIGLTRAFGNLIWPHRGRLIWPQASGKSMAICRYCGQKAGWFSEAHEECITSAQQGSERVASAVTSTVVDKLIPPKHSDDETWVTAFAEKVWSETKPQLDQLATEHRIPANDIRNALLKGWSTGAEQVATAEPLSPDRQAPMNAFVRIMAFTDQDICKTDGFVAGCFSVLLWSVIVHGDPTQIANVSHHPFNLRGGETPLFFFGSVLYSKETVSRSSQGGYGGMSIRLARGVYYHFGGFKGQRVDTSTLKEIDYGGMLLTTQNIYFGGDRTGENRGGRRTQCR